MARLARLEVPGLPHLLLQRGHNGEAVVRDDEDIKALHAALLQASRDQAVAVHAYGIWPQGFLLMLTPSRSRALGLMMQSVGRRYAAHFNRRHARSGGVWDGRFRATVVEADVHALDAQHLVESSAGAVAITGLRAAMAGQARPMGSVGLIAAAVQSAAMAPRDAAKVTPTAAPRAQPAVSAEAAHAANASHGADAADRSQAAVGVAGAPAEIAIAVHSAGDEPLHSSLAHHLGQRRDPLIHDAPAYWALGNTPFERESAWRSRLHLGLDPTLARRLADAVDKGWALGGAAFAAEMARITQRRTTPLPRGRPRKVLGAAPSPVAALTAAEASMRPPEHPTPASIDTPAAKPADHASGQS